jgi:hypothetical protein
MKNKAIFKLRKAFIQIWRDELHHSIIIKTIGDSLSPEKHNPDHDNYKVTITDVLTGEIIFDDIVDRNIYSREQMYFNLSHYSGHYRWGDDGYSDEEYYEE